VVRRRTLRIVALALLAALAGALLWALWGFDAYYRQRPVNGTQIRQPPSSAQVERGQYLARVGNCVFCHTAPAGEMLAGGRPIQTPFGTVVSSNLTPDSAHGLGRWTQDDFWQALHLGLGPQGQRLSPAFPYTSYSRLTRTDADALWAYLQSVPAVPRSKTDTKMVWPFGTQTALGLWRAMYFRPYQNANESSAPVGADTVAWTRGRYLVEGLGHCQECHSPRDALGGMRDASRGTGAVLPGLPWYAPSLRDTAQAGTNDGPALQSFLQTGVGAGRFAAGPMAEVVLHGTQYLNDQDAQAMAVYLQSLVPNKPDGSRPHAHQDANTVRLASSSSIATAGAAQVQGADIYKNNCADCHGDQGQGRESAYPALAGNRALLMDKPNNAVLSVLYGGFAPSTQGNAQPFGMPPFMLELSNAQIAQVLTYARSAWGNQAAAISELQVQAVRDPRQHR
jgi:mono/diheme cytochrome c family protein